MRIRWRVFCGPIRSWWGQIEKSFRRGVRKVRGEKLKHRGHRGTQQRSQSEAAEFAEKSLNTRDTEVHRKDREVNPRSWRRKA